MKGIKRQRDDYTLSSRSNASIGEDVSNVIISPSKYRPKFTRHYIRSTMKNSFAKNVVCILFMLLYGTMSADVILNHSHRDDHIARSCIKQIRLTHDPILVQSEYAKFVWNLLYLQSDKDRAGSKNEQTLDQQPSPQSLDFSTLPSDLRSIFFDHSTRIDCKSASSLSATGVHSLCKGIQVGYQYHHLDAMCWDLQDRIESDSFFTDLDIPAGFPSPPLASLERYSSLYGHLQRFDEEYETMGALNRRALQTVQQCKIALAVGDTNRDDILSPNAEYLRFVNQLSGQQYSSVTSYDDLPLALQENYDQNADSAIGGIDIAGSKPGQSATAAQEEQINTMCDSTIAALSGDTTAPQPSSGGGGSDRSPTGPPEPSSGGGVVSNNADCTGTIQRSQCNTALAIADLSRDDLLNEEEYVRFVNRLSNNQYAGSSYDDLPSTVKESFDKFATGDSGQVDIFGSKPGQSAEMSQDEFIDSFCCETDLALSNPGTPTEPVPSPPMDNGGNDPTLAPPPSGGENGPDIDCTGTVSRSQCNTALSISDLSRDDLLSEDEFIRFINRLSSNAYAGESFDQLPGNLQTTFSKFATPEGQIDIYGSKPGQTATPEQDQSLDALCCETDLAVQNPGPGTPTAIQPSPAPEPSQPTAVESLPPTFANSFCRTSMASSDFNRDDKLDQEEYVRFLNRLTGSEFDGVTFEELDAALQANYVRLATSDGQIDIFGSKPGQGANDEEEAFLDQICLDTAIALSGGGALTPTTAPDKPSEGDPTPPPTFGETTCYTAMAFADFNRDDYINEEEFVRFLNRLTGDEYDGFESDDLPPELVAAYAALVEGSDNGEIYIFGSKPGQTATEDQEAFLQQLCFDVSVAIGGDAPTPSSIGPTPSGGGIPASPTFTPGFSEVYNSFIVANTVGLTANQLESGANREGLNEAYSEFAQTAVDQLNAVATNSRQLLEGVHLRRRKLEVALAPDSDEIYLLLDSTCPDDTAAGSTCQTAFAKFQVSITDEDPQGVSDEYTAATQVLISDGLLQTILTDVDPRNLLTIANASFPVTMTFPPSAVPDVPTAPPSNPPVEPDSGGGGGSNAGAIVGGLVGGLLICALIGYVYVKGLPFSIPSFGGSRGDKQTDDEDEGGFGQDDDASAGGGDGFGDDNDNALGGGDDDKGPEQSPGDRNVFGFGKKNKPSSDNTGFGDNDDDEDDDDDAFGMKNEGDKNTFDKPGGMYAFDEPSEVAEDNDHGSAGGDDDMFGAGPSSPGWGNTDNAFGSADQGWGTGGADTNISGGDNFFGASAFGGENGRGEGSRSGSESDSYSSSEDSTYQSDNVDGEEDTGEDGTSYDEDETGETSFSRSSADEGTDSYNSGSTPASMASDLRKKNEDMEAAIESGDWDAVAQTADTLGRGQDSSLEGSSKKESEASPGDGDLDGEESYSGSSRSGSVSESGASGTSASTTSEEMEKRAEFRAQVDALVRLVLPDEVEKVDAMMEQFKGREAELVSTLQTMQERSANQRARAAVHKSKNRPQRPDGADGAYALGVAGGVQGGEGSAAGTAAIAAASLPIPAAGMFDEAEAGFADDAMQDGFAQDAFADDYVDDQERSYYSDEEEEEEGPFSDEESGSRSHYSDEEGSGSQYSQEEGSYSEHGSQSYVSGEGSQSYRSGESASQSYRSGEEGSYYSGEEEEGPFSDEQSGSHSQYSGEEGTGSQYSQEEGSYSEHGSQSYVSGEGSQSYRSRESGSQSHQRGEEGSYYSGEEEEEEGPFSDEESGSHSQYSGEVSGSQYSERSYEQE